MRFRDMRMPCDTLVAVLLGGEQRTARFVNISATGAKLEGAGRLPREAPVTVAHLHHRVAARVVWSNERFLGLRFVLPLSPVELGALRGVVRGVPVQGQAIAPRFREMT